MYVYFVENFLLEKSVFLIMKICLYFVRTRFHTNYKFIAETWIWHDNMMYPFIYKLIW